MFISNQNISLSLIAGLFLFCKTLFCLCSGQVINTYFIMINTYSTLCTLSLLFSLIVTLSRYCSVLIDEDVIRAYISSSFVKVRVILSLVDIFFQIYLILTIRVETTSVWVIGIVYSCIALIYFESKEYFQRDDCSLYKEVIPHQYHLKTEANTNDCDDCPCYICYGDIDYIAVLKCDHKIHKKCLQMWWNVHKSYVCPICRT